MTVLLYLVPAALALGLMGLGAFLWSMRTGQYEDMEGAAVRILTDDDLETPQEETVSAVHTLPPKEDA